MSSENFDNKIKDSLNQGSYSYDESSWQKMKTLLDKHLPEKKDNRRRLFIFLFIFLLLGGGTTVFLNKPEAEKIKPEEIVATSADINGLPQNSVEKSENTTADHPESASESDLVSSVKRISVSKKNPNSSATETSSLTEKTKSEYSKTNSTTEKITGKISESAGEEKTGSVIISNTNENILSDKKDADKTKEIVEPGKENIEAEMKKGTDDLEKDQLPVESKKALTKKKQPFLKNIEINLSAGPDISSVGNQTGSVKIIPGIGIGYRISDHFSIRSGFFTGKKVYTTTPEYYNPPSNFWTYYPNLKQIEANCKVIDILINLDYKFAITNSHNWFVSAGASSFIMKKEDYNYYYKPANSQQYVYYKRSFENKNNHYFSVLNLSGGYSRKISPVLTLQAEPYLKIAMKGVGYGKVKLNSSGVLFTASFRPFQSKK